MVLNLSYSFALITNCLGKSPFVAFVCVCVCACALSHFSCVQLFATLWTVACQAPLSMGFSRQENRSGLLCPPPGDLPNPGIEPASLTSTCIGSQILYRQHYLGSS